MGVELCWLRVQGETAEVGVPAGVLPAAAAVQRTVGESFREEVAEAYLVAGEGPRGPSLLAAVAGVHRGQTAPAAAAVVRFLSNFD